MYQIIARWSVLVHAVLLTLLLYRVGLLLITIFSFTCVVSASGSATLISSISILMRKKQSVTIFFVGVYFEAIAFRSKDFHVSHHLAAMKHQKVWQ